MRKFLRFLMLVLMATWGAESYAESVQLKARQFNKESSQKKDFTDFTVECTQGKIWKNFEKKDSYMYRDDYNGTGTGQKETLIFPIGSRVTITGKNGALIDFVVISFNNGGSGNWANHSEHWSKVMVNGSTDTGTTYYHPHEQENGHYTNCAWWGKDDGSAFGASSVTFCDDRTDYGSWRLSKQAQTTGIYWFYIIYHKASTTPTLTATGDGTTFDGEQGGSVTFTQSNSTAGNFNSLAGIYYTDDGSDPTTSSTKKYTGEIKNFNCTTKIRAVGQWQMKAWQQLNADGLDKESDLKSSSDKINKKMPDYYNITSSSPKDALVTQVWPVTVKNGYATFAHSNKMTVPNGYTAQAYKAGKTNANGITSIVPCGTAFTGGDIIPANTAVILSGSNASNVTFKNPLNNKYSNSNTDAQETAADNTAKAKVSGNCLYGYYNSSTKVTNNSSYYYYYLMKESSASNSRYGFFWANNDGSAVTSSNWVKNLVHKAYFMYPKKNAAKGFVFQLPDEQETTGITGVSNGHEGRGLDPSAPMYNAAGQRVGASYKGIVIQNGRKFIKR